MRTKKTKGFTLIEIMLSVAVLGILGSLLSTFYLQIYKSYTKTDAKTRVTQVAIGTLGSLQKQLREVSQAPTCVTNTTLHPTSASPISFYIPSLTDPTTRASDDRIEYYIGTYDGKNTLLQRLVRSGTTYTAIPVMFDFDIYRNNPANIPRGGGVAAFISDPTFLFDDAAFFYDSEYNMICVGLTVSVADRGKSGKRETLTLSSAIAFRNTF
jgi:prepilin-type N-terminal cleavage/methylation domain-containing protein